MTKNNFNSTKRFGNRVENYAKYRPSYPKEVLSLINLSIVEKQDFVIADIASGTGIFTDLLLETGRKVYAVEPNLEMRSYAENYLKNRHNFVSVDGTAEETNLEAASVDLLTAAQAFHWFDPVAAKNEFLRILRDNGLLLLIWNDRKIQQEGFSFEYEKLVKRECPEYNETTHKNIDDKRIEEFYHPNSVKKYVFDNYQDFNFEELKGRLMSSSYVPVDNKIKMEIILAELKNIYDKYNVNGLIKFEYATTVYLGKLK